ncbi:MAG: hypothetical protein ACT4N2_13365 [Hyphomicrobium sp.]
MSFLKRFAPGLRDLSGRNPPPRRAHAGPLPSPISDVRQWGRLEDVVSRATSGQVDVSRLHSEASLHLDAAGYALGRLMIELSAVMTIAVAPQSNAEVVPIRIPVRAASPLRPRKAMAA